MRNGLLTAALLSLAAAGAQAAEYDCYNDDSETYHREALPDALRITDAEIGALRLAIARHEARMLAERKAEKEKTASIPAPKDGG